MERDRTLGNEPEGSVQPARGSVPGIDHDLHLIRSELGQAVHDTGGQPSTDPAPPRAGLHPDREELGLRKVRG
jgi:hypothetical protein